MCQYLATLRVFWAMMMEALFRDRRRRRTTQMCSTFPTVSFQSEQLIPPGQVFLKSCDVSLRSTSCAKADPDPAAMRQAKIAAKYHALDHFRNAFHLILLSYFRGSGAIFHLPIPRSHQKAESVGESPHRPRKIFARAG